MSVAPASLPGRVLRPFSAVVRFTCLVLSAALLTTAQAQTTFCATPGKDGPLTVPSGGVVNTYYPGITVSAGSLTLSLGTPLGDTSKAIAVGDLLLVMQMQDADLNAANSSAYAISAVNKSGQYEYVVAKSALAANAAGSVTIGSTGAGGGLLRDYISSVAGAQGQKRFQVIRVPQYSSAAFTSALTALPWNGSVGGVLAMDVAGQANMSGATVSVTGLGFRGGGGRALLGGSVSGVAPTNDDYRFPTSSPVSSTAGRHGSKGEGIAGTPRAVNSSLNLTPLVVDTAAEGYPSGSAGRGAPGNAGGGGTDDDTANANNSGGGGGSNGGVGGRGGDGYNGTDTARATPLGGIGGADFTAANSARIVLGGGGGAGSSNNNSSGGQDPSYASGARGGGLILLRAGSLSGTGTLSADGNDAPDYLGNDAAGGGGAGGSVLVYAASSAASLSINVRGGAGGDADTSTFTTPHGPGGGGGGGVVYTNVSAVTNVLGGPNGLTPLSATTVGPLTAANSTAFTSAPGAPGESGSLVASPTDTGVGPAAACLPLLTVTKSTSTPSRTLGTDTTATYTITVSNAANRAAATEVVLSDALPAPFTYASTGAVTLAGGATRTTTTSPAVGVAVASWGTFTLPGGSSVTLPLTVTLNAASGTYQNPATATYLDPQRTVATGTTNASYVAASSTGEDVTVTAALQLSGRVYSDANVNGTLDATESGLAGVTVQLYNAAGTTLISTASTDGSGNYTFPVTASTSYTAVVPTAPTGQGPINPSPARRSVTVGAVSVTGQNFGFNAVPTCASGSLLAVGRDSTNDLGYLYGVNATSGVVGPLLKTLAAQTSAVARDPNTGRVYYATRSTVTPTVSDLRAVDLTTGQDVVVGTVSGITGGQVVTRMAINAAGLGYLMIADGSALYSFTTGAGNTSTITNLGSVTTTSGVAISSYGSGDMAIDGNGVLWAVFTNNTTNEAILFTIDPATRSAVPVDRVTVGGVTATLLFNGLAFTTSGVLYGTTGNEVYTISPANAVATAVTTGTNTNPTTDLASCVYPVISPSLSLTKTVSVSVAKPGDTLTYTIVATNSGTAAATGVRLTDAIPANTTYLAGSTTTNGVATSDVSGGVMPYAAGGQIGSAGSFPSVITVGAGKAVTVTFKVTVNTPYPDGAAGVSNAANVTYSGGPPGGLTTPPASTGIGTDLVVTKTGPQFASAGVTITYTLTASNAGLRGANGAVLRDAGVANFTPTSLTCTPSNGAVCPVGLNIATLAAGQAIATFPAGGSLLLTVSGTVGTGPIVNGVTISVPAALSELTPANNSASATTQVINLILTKEVRNCGPISPGAACPGSAVWGISGIGKPGDVLEYRVTYLNSGSANAASLVIDDPVPSNTIAQLNGYGIDSSGKSLGLSWVLGTAAPLKLTSVSLDDAGSLNTALKLTVGVVTPGMGGNVSFRAMIR
ncbi:beta strand repeat-containing protein [Deinococcus aquatilis]|uniref:beta strand repeat-containing protein n=1 Tax=Deinococcus aquatilis TaxID=519440 RepID=UPI00037780C6|nr:SdrD B-like domain-containing protein [Deinococcus aquatilis]